jgi:hypothetical protein
MLNRLLAVLVFAAMSVTAANANEQVNSAFKRIDEQGLQRLKRPNFLHDERAANKQALAEIETLNSDLNGLSPSELVSVIKLCREQVHKIPSDSKHFLYADYHNQAILFSIGDLGKQKTDAAKKALDEVKPLISGAAQLQESWDEAKAKQSE